MTTLTKRVPRLRILVSPLYVRQTLLDDSTAPAEGLPVNFAEDRSQATNIAFQIAPLTKLCEAGVRFGRMWYYLAVKKRLCFSRKARKPNVKGCLDDAEYRLLIILRRERSSWLCTPYLRSPHLKDVRKLSGRRSRKWSPLNASHNMQSFTCSGITGCRSVAFASTFVQSHCLAVPLPFDFLFQFSISTKSSRCSCQICSTSG